MPYKKLHLCVRTAFAGDYKCDVCGRLEHIKPDIIGKDLAEIAERIAGAVDGEILQDVMK